jgi:excisionase family DNA binding protein
MKTQKQETPTYPSVRALAEDLHLGYQKTYAALREGKIPSIRIGKRFVLPRQAIQDWLKTAGQAS